MVQNNLTKAKSSGDVKFDLQAGAIGKQSHFDEYSFLPTSDFNYNGFRIGAGFSGLIPYSGTRWSVEIKHDIFYSFGNFNSRIMTYCRPDVMFISAPGQQKQAKRHKNRHSLLSCGFKEFLDFRFQRMRRKKCRSFVNNQQRRFTVLRVLFDLFEQMEE